MRVQFAFTVLLLAETLERGWEAGEGTVGCAPRIEVIKLITFDNIDRQ